MDVFKKVEKVSLVLTLNIDQKNFFPVSRQREMFGTLFVIFNPFPILYPLVISGGIKWQHQPEMGQPSYCLAY